jgi:hypothetical protein
VRLRPNPLIQPASAMQSCSLPGPEYYSPGAVVFALATAFVMRDE